MVSDFRHHMSRYYWGRLLVSPPFQHFRFITEISDYFISAFTVMPEVFSSLLFHFQTFTFRISIYIFLLHYFSFDYFHYLASFSHWLQDIFVPTLSFHFHRFHLFRAENSSEYYFFSWWLRYLYIFIMAISYFYAAEITILLSLFHHFHY